MSIENQRDLATLHYAEEIKKAIERRFGNIKTFELSIGGTVIKKSDTTSISHDSDDLVIVIYDAIQYNKLNIRSHLYITTEGKYRVFFRVPFGATQLTLEYEQD